MARRVAGLMHPMPDEPPPFLGNWRRVYTLVLLYLAAVITVFWIFTRYFA